MRLDLPSCVIRDGSPIVRLRVSTVSFRTWIEAVTLTESRVEGGLWSRIQFFECQDMSRPDECQKSFQRAQEMA